MQPVSSRTTNQRMIRSTLLTVLIGVFAIAFVWDGHIRYPRKNAQQLAESLGVDPPTPRVINQNLTADSARIVVEQLGRGGPRSALDASLGPPAIQHDRDLYYLGPGGHLCVQVERGKVVAFEPWVDGVYPDSELLWQRYLGYLLGVVTLALVVNWLGVMAARASVTDAGFRMGRGAVIPFPTMTAIRIGRRGEGSIELEYTVKDRKCTVRFDDYRLAKFEAILQAICERSGLPDPRGA